MSFRKIIVIFGFLNFFSLAGMSAQDIPPSPPPEKLQAGDLIWPKKPGAIVPYNSEPGEATKTLADNWINEKIAYLDELSKLPKTDYEERERYRALSNMTYSDFCALYQEDRPIGEPSDFGSGSISIGHVGIIQIVDGSPQVIEAMMGKGVQRIPYAKWISDRKGEIFWVGRLTDFSPEKRASIAEIASSYIGKPYKFWNFNLEDTSGFYCSKLAWLSIKLGVGVVPDDNTNAKRVLWYSPKQLIRSRYIKLISAPGNYGSK